MATKTVMMPFGTPNKGPVLESGHYKRAREALIRGTQKTGMAASYIGL